jgi:hypothetical protein
METDTQLHKPNRGKKKKTKNRGKKKTAEANRRARNESNSPEEIEERTQHRWGRQNPNGLQESLLAARISRGPPGRNKSEPNEQERRRASDLGRARNSSKKQIESKRR